LYSKAPGCLPGTRSQWLGKQSYLDDLASLDSELYQGLIFLKHYSGDLADLALNFTVTQDEFGVARSVELIPNGSNIPVTKENRLKYIYLVSLYKLSRQIRKQSDAFFDGLSEMIDPKWLRYVSCPSHPYPTSPSPRIPILSDT
jgi:ubiquitin-protein ligase E3 C